jgi:fucose permease
VHVMLRIALWSVAVGVALIWADAGVVVTGAGLLIAGIACGPIFPSLIATTPGRVGSSHSANAVGFEIAASAVGLSVVPAIVGVAAATFGLATIARLFVVLAVLLLLAYRVLERLPPPAAPAR